MATTFNPPPATEEENKEALVEAFSPYFHIEREVRGKLELNGNTFRPRIDLMMFPKPKFEFFRGGPSEGGWLRPDIAIGVEVKSSGDPIKAANPTPLWEQAQTYALTKWNGVKGGYAPIFMYPGPGLLNQYLCLMLKSQNVGQIVRQEDRGWCLVMSYCHYVWCEREYGVTDGYVGHAGRTWSLLPRVGSSRLK